MAPNYIRSSHGPVPLYQVYLHLPEEAVRSFMVSIVIYTMELFTDPLPGEGTREPFSTSKEWHLDLFCLGSYLRFCDFSLAVKPIRYIGCAVEVPETKISNSRFQGFPFTDHCFIITCGISFFQDDSSSSASCLRDNCEACLSSMGPILRLGI